MALPLPEISEARRRWLIEQNATVTFPPPGGVGSGSRWSYPAAVNAGRGEEWIRQADHGEYMRDASRSYAATRPTPGPLPGLEFRGGWEFEPGSARSSRSGIHLQIRRRSIPHGWTARGWRRRQRRGGAVHRLS